MKTVDVVFDSEMKLVGLRVNGSPIDIGEWDLSQPNESVLHLPLEPLVELVSARSMVASKDAYIEELRVTLQDRERVIEKFRATPFAPEPALPPPEVTPQYLLFELAKLITKV